MTLRVAMLAVWIAFANSSAAAPVPKAAKSTADKVVGRWHLAMSRGAAPSSKHIITLTRDGVMTIDVGSIDNGIRYSGKYKIVDNAIDYEMMQGDYKKAEKLTIKHLSDDDMRTTDPDGIDEEFKRIKD